MKLINALAAVAALSAGVALAAGDKTPNCDVKGKLTHVKDQKACEKKKGTWKEAAHDAAAPAPEAAHDAAAPAPAK